MPTLRELRDSVAAQAPLAPPPMTLRQLREAKGTAAPAESLVQDPAAAMQATFAAEQDAASKDKRTLEEKQKVAYAQRKTQERVSAGGRAVKAAFSPATTPLKFGLDILGDVGQATRGTVNQLINREAPFSGPEGTGLFGTGVFGPQMDAMRRDLSANDMLLEQGINWQKSTQNGKPLGPVAGPAAMLAGTLGDFIDPTLLVGGPALTAEGKLAKNVSMAIEEAKLAGNAAPEGVGLARTFGEQVSKGQAQLGSFGPLKLTGQKAGVLATPVGKAVLQAEHFMRSNPYARKLTNIFDVAPDLYSGPRKEAFLALSSQASAAQRMGAERVVNEFWPMAQEVYKAGSAAGLDQSTMNRIISDATEAALTLDDVPRAVNEAVMAATAGAPRPDIVQAAINATLHNKRINDEALAMRQAAGLNTSEISNMGYQHHDLTPEARNFIETFRGKATAGAGNASEASTEQASRVMRKLVDPVTGSKPTLSRANEMARTGWVEATGLAPEADRAKQLAAGMGPYRILKGGLFEENPFVATANNFAETARAAKKAETLAAFVRAEGRTTPKPQRRPAAAAPTALLKNINDRISWLEAQAPRALEVGNPQHAAKLRAEIAQLDKQLTGVLEKAGDPDAAAQIRRSVALTKDDSIGGRLAARANEQRAAALDPSRQAVNQQGQRASMSLKEQRAAALDPRTVTPQNLGIDVAIRDLKKKAAEVEANSARLAETQALVDEKANEKFWAESHERMAKEGYEPVDTGLRDNPVVYLPSDMAATFKSQGAGDPLGSIPGVRQYDTLQNAFKTMALSTPGFHIRNQVQEMFNTMWMEGMGVDPIGKAIAMQKDPVATARLRELGVTGTGQSGEFRNKVDRLRQKNPVQVAAETVQGKSFDAGEWRQDLMRTAFYLHARDRGETELQAVRSVNEVLGDYRHGLTDTESGLFKRIMPFYTWQRFFAPYMAKRLAQQPGKFLAPELARKAFTGGHDPEGPNGESLRGYQTEGLPMLMGGRVNSMSNFTGMDALNAPTPNAMFGMVSPLIKTPFELAANKSTFTGQQIEGFPGEKGFTGLPAKAEYALSSVARPVADFAKAMTPGGSVKERLMRSSAMGAEVDWEKNAEGEGIKMEKKMRELESAMGKWQRKMDKATNDHQRRIIQGNIDTIQKLMDKYANDPSSVPEK